MERCVFCQAALDTETRFCWQCGHARSSMLLVEATSPSQILALPARRCVVCGAVVPREASACGNCLTPLPASEGVAPGLDAALPGPQKRCTACGESSPLWARFCGSCRQPFTPPATRPEEITIVGTATDAAGEAAALFPASAAFAAETAAWQVAAAPPSLPSVAQSTPRQKSFRLRLKLMAALLVTALMVTTGGVTLAYFLTRPSPVLRVSSSSRVGNTPAGSPSTTLQVSGQNFSHHSSVTILLDGAAAPGAHAVPTDGEGSFQVSLMVTEAWRYGLHTLTATDARGYTTRSGVQVRIIPRPVIVVQSAYQQNGLPAGASNTRLHITGKWFSYHSQITFLLDGQPAPDSQSVQSDEQGQVEADLLVTDEWTMGNHTLTAKDAQGYATQRGQQLAIVPQGQASTPGPNGAPADNATFTLVVTVQAQNALTGQSSTMQETLVITGQADPAGGTVCQARDNGQPYVQNGVLFDATGMPTSLSYQETLTATCSGHYQSGHLDYTETAISDVYVLSNGLTCQASTPYTLQTLTGSFEDATTSSGDWSASGVSITCPPGLTFITRADEQGNWSGTIQ